MCVGGEEGGSSYPLHVRPRAHDLACAVQRVRTLCSLTFFLGFVTVCKLLEPTASRALPW